MVCVPCVLVPILLFLWAIFKHIINWFRRLRTGEENNINDDQVCSLLSSCPCISKPKSSGDEAEKPSESETLKEEPLEASVNDKKNI